MDKLDGFQLFLTARGCKVSTIRFYLYALRRIHYLAGKLTLSNIHKAFHLLQDQGRRGRYLNNLVSALRLWCQYQKLPNLATFPFFREEPFIKATMSDEEIEAFLSLKPWYSKQSKKVFSTWTLFFEIMAYSGMRPGEVAHLKVEDVDFGRSVFILEDTKTNQPRFVPIAPNLTEKLKLHLATCNEYLFPATKGGNSRVVRSVDWHYNFQTRLMKLGIKRKNLTPYSLRHSLITRLLEEDVNIFKVMKIAGHTQISTTMGYTHLTTKDIQQAITKHPLILKSLDPEKQLQSLKEYIHSQNFCPESFEVVETNQSISVMLK